MLIFSVACGLALWRTSASIRASQYWLCFLPDSCGAANPGVLCNAGIFSQTAFQCKICDSAGFGEQMCQSQSHGAHAKMAGPPYPILQQLQSPVQPRRRPAKYLAILVHLVATFSPVACRVLVAASGDILARKLLSSLREKKERRPPRPPSGLPRSPDYSAAFRRSDAVSDSRHNVPQRLLPLSVSDIPFVWDSARPVGRSISAWGVVGMIPPPP